MNALRGTKAVWVGLILLAVLLILGGLFVNWLGNILTPPTPGLVGG